MRARLWGTRGSIAAAGPETVRYGGDTSSVEVRLRDDRLVVLDGGSGLRPMDHDTGDSDRIDVLLSHLHMDHVQGLPFFPPLLDPDVEVHVWGPVSTTRTLRDRIARYLSPPLFPVRVRDLSNVFFHDVVPGEFELGSLRVTADLITHPGPTLGYRLEENGSVLTYMSDHEPALGNDRLDAGPEWISGFALAAGSDVLIHDAQYSDEEYQTRVGWGHSSTSHLATFAEMTGVGHLVTFHHDPAHTDEQLDGLHLRLESMLNGTALSAGTPGLSLEL